ncbi:MAG: hypothetical protein AAF907_08680, partial [Planctomycetota bacterium]
KRAVYLHTEEGATPTSAITEVAAAYYSRHAGRQWGRPIFVANAFSIRPWGMRRAGEGVDHCLSYAKRVKVALVSAHDLLSLLICRERPPWSHKDVWSLVCSTTGSCSAPPNMRKSGTLSRVYEKASALSVNLDDEVTLRKDDAIAFRGVHGYAFQLAESIQRKRVELDSVTGGVIGLKTPISMDFFVKGEPVYIYCRSQ